MSRTRILGPRLLQPPTQPSTTGGTTPYPGEFAILPTEADAFTESGLSYATKFDLGKIFELDYNDIWFGVPPQAPYGQHPKLGILHPSLLRRAKAAHTAASRRA